MVFQLQRLYLFDYILLHFYPDVAMSYLTSNSLGFFGISIHFMAIIGLVSLEPLRFSKDWVYP